MEPGPRQDRISDLYHRALACTPDERSAFLQAVCAGDAALRDEVESLLRFESDSAGFLETPAAVVASGSAGTPDRPMIGRQLGPYTILSPLGSGGMGEVYRARDNKLRRDVALKILPSHFTSDPERRARFTREARLLATLNHPHIGAIHGLEDADGVTALVLELVEGPTLADRLARGPLPIAEALAIARQIAEALDAAHEKGIVHRDLKPANIVLQSSANAAGVPSSDVRAKVLDFGLAKTMAVGLDGDLTQRPPSSLDGTEEGRILGTPAYMSPEQARGQAVDKRTDIWAFGCVLFEMLSGRRAFDGDTISDTFVSILEHEPDWAALPANTLGSIRTLLDRCLRKDPRKRLHDIADALIEIDDRSPAAASSAGAGDASTLVVARRRSHERFAWVVAAVFGLAFSAMAWLHIPAIPPAFGSLEIPIAPPENWLYIGNSSPTFEVSPDGRHVAVTALSQREGVAMLWVRPIASPAWRQLLGTQGAHGLFWSPDSQSLGFFAGGKLKTIRVTGDSPVILSDAPGTGQGDVFSAAWSRDGVILLAEGANSLRRIGPSGENSTPVTTLGKSDIAHRWPSFLPDGQHFLYLAMGLETSELRVGLLGSADTTSLGPAESNARYASDYLLFVRGGRLMAEPFDTASRELKGDPVVVAEQIAILGPWEPGQFSVSENGVLAYRPAWRPMSQLTWMDRTGKTVETVGDPGFYPNLNLNQDDRRVAVSHLKELPGTESNLDIWIIDPARAGTATRLTFNAAREHDPAWSPDRTQIAFNSNRTGEKFSLWVRASNGSGEDALLVDSGSNISAPDWSPDGRFLMYSQLGESTRRDLWSLPLPGGRKPTAFLQTPFNEGGGAFSPDGHWVAYESDASGRLEVYVRPFPVQEGVHPISRSGGRAPRWRGDGRELFFLALDGTLMAARTETGKAFQASVPQVLFPTGISTSNFHPYDVAKDGQRFLIPVTLNPAGAKPMTVVWNWPAVLRK